MLTQEWLSVTTPLRQLQLGKYEKDMLLLLREFS
jgi:hypothetical protein